MTTAQGREEIRNILAAYQYFGDRGHAAELAGLFADDGRLVSEVGSARGPEQIEHMITSRAADNQARTGGGRVRHHLTTVYFKMDADSAETVSYFQVLTNAGLDHWGTYRDTFALRDGRWQITEHSVRIDGEASSDWRDTSAGSGLSQ
jgi:hypothetical protein